MGIGKRGTFSRGKIHPSDEGDLSMAIGHSASEVVIQFGTPVGWLGLEPDKAEAFANLILQHAKAIRGKAQ